MRSVTPSGAQAMLLEGGRKLHLQHGPIDLMIEVGGDAGKQQRAHAAAIEFFADVLTTLAGELPQLRTEMSAFGPMLNGEIARAMGSACAPFVNDRVTPMASVAGAVADAVLAAMCDAVDLPKAWVNNGGDIAFHITPGYDLRCGLVTNVACPQQDAVAVVTAHDRVRGIASSGCATYGRGGRSFSLGIADCVTVLADNAARADAAATLIGNAVDLPGDARIARRPASDLQIDSDLGDRLVTVDVGPLDGVDIDAALARGLQRAEQYLKQGLIEGGALFLRRQYRFFGRVPRLEEEMASHEGEDSKVPSGH